MNGETSLVALLRLLLHLPDGSTRATPSFSGWISENASDTGGPGPDRQDLSQAQLLLIDTRDRTGRALVPHIAAHDSALAAALVLTGSGAPGSPIRRLLRRVRRPGTRRLPEWEVRPFLDRSGLITTRLIFDDSAEVPSDFVVDDTRTSTGAAFILTHGPLFEGPLWNVVRSRLSSAFEIRRLQLRERGAAIVMGAAEGQEYVLRIVAPGQLQTIVRRNAELLARLRGLLSSRSDLLALLPEPVFSETVDGIAVLAETCLPGRLAWMVADGSDASAIYREAIRFLENLRGATLVDAEVDASRLMEPDFQHLRDAAAVSTVWSQRLEETLLRASRDLSDVRFSPSASHGDFGYGNIIVDVKGSVTGVIDWDTARLVDFPGIDRVNLEIQLARRARSFPDAVKAVWETGLVRDTLAVDAAADRVAASWALYSLGVTRYILRALTYPTVFRREAPGFEEALSWIESNPAVARAAS